MSVLGLIALATIGVGSLFRDEWLGNNLDLLQLTGVSGFDLLLAKLIPLWLTAISLLLLEIPCFLLCITLGGVTPLQVTAVIWQLAWLFLVTSSITVLSAALFRRPLSILAGAGILLFVYQLVGWWFDMLMWHILHGTSSPTTGQGSFPGVSWPDEFYARIFRAGFVGPVIGWTVLIHIAVVAGCLIRVAQILRKRLSAPREELSVEETAPEGTAHQSVIPVWRPSYLVPPIGRQEDAIEWKDYHFTLGGDDMMNGKWALATVAITLLMIFSIPLYMAEVRGANVQDEFVCMGFFIFIAILAPLGSMVHMAHWLWMQEIRERTLDSLLLLPISAKDIIHAKLRTFARMCLPEIALYATEFVVIFVLSWTAGEWGVCCLFLGLLLSIPMIVCTDAAWRFIPRDWEGLKPRAVLALSVLFAWGIGGVFGCAGGPLVGVIILAVLVPLVCRSAIHLAADSLSNHAGELMD